MPSFHYAYRQPSFPLIYDLELLIIYAISSLFCYAFMHACLSMPCCNLLGKSWPLGVRLWCLSYCDVVTFPLSSWARCGAWLYRFLIFALFLTLTSNHLRIWGLANQHAIKEKVKLQSMIGLTTKHAVCCNTLMVCIINLLLIIIF